MPVIGQQYVNTLIDRVEALETKITKDSLAPQLYNMGIGGDIYGIIGYVKAITDLRKD